MENHSRVGDWPRLEQFAGGAVIAEVVNGHAGGMDGERVERLGLDDLQVVELGDADRYVGKVIAFTAGLTSTWSTVGP